MTDAAPADPRPVQGAPSRPSLLAPSDRMKRRNAAEARFRAYGLIAISTAGALLVVLLWNILSAGLPAFQRTVVTVDFTLTEDQFDAAESVLFKTREYETYFIAALSDQLRDRGLDLEFDSASVERLLGKVGATLRSHYRDNPDAIGQPVRFELPTSSRVERYFKGGFARADIGDANRFITAGDLDLADALKQAGVLRTAFNWTFVTGVDTGSDNPGGAGIGASVVGSFFMMLVVLVLSLPIGVAASIYLEEFAPQNRFTDFIEVNISNLAAVPSIVFGILGLAVFIQFGGGQLEIQALKASAPLVGGLVLSLMTLPTIIIATRAALKSVPPSIREAALGVGASKMQAVFHHVLPLAMPGILTGAIIGLAQALGETAPLLLIGMVGFIARYPETFMGGFEGPNSALPAQIYNWASRSDATFIEKAWGGIIVLLLFMLTMNLIAIILRRRFERRW